MQGPSPVVHGLCTYDGDMNAYNLLVWNFSDSEVDLRLNLSGSPAHLRGSHVVVDAITASNEAFAQLRRQPSLELIAGEGVRSIHVEAYGINFISSTKASHAA